MPFVTTEDGTEIFYKDWGDRQPIVFHHGWPLSADDWDNQMMFFLQHGYRVIAHDRRGHGRSTQTPGGHDMDFSETDFTEDLQAIECPPLVMHGDDDQIVPFADAAPLSVKLLKNGTLKVYPGYPHGMCTIHGDVINPDLLAFIQS